MPVPGRVVKPAGIRAAPRQRPEYLIVFYLLFSLPLFVLHSTLLSLPYFWDEQGQFIPTALDLLRHGEWIAHSTLPNVHPPGVEAYLVLWYLVFGYSIVVTRIAMLFVASAGLLLTFLLSIELSRETKGSPAFWPPLLLLLSPLFYMQSFMAQLDMPAMVLTCLAFLLFLKRRYAICAAACVALVLTKETGIVTALVFALWLMRRQNWRAAAYFTAPALALGIWLITLHAGTGYWLGNPGFAHYNVEYSLHPVRIALTLVRRFYYLFIAEFRWIGTLVLIFTARSVRAFRKDRWMLAFVLAGVNILLVSVLGGAELERYLLPVLPLFYIAVAIALSSLRRSIGVPALAATALGLIGSVFWNPPYPFPYENNWAMVDFVRLQEIAASYAERNLAAGTIATAWPYTTGLENPDFGYVKHRLRVLETNDFSESSIAALHPDNFQYLIVYTRTWAPPNGFIQSSIVRRFLAHFYQWQPEVTSGQCEKLGLFPRMTWSLRGQRITIYSRDPHAGTAYQTL